MIWAQGKIRRIDVATGQATVIPFHIQDTRQMTRRVRFPIEVAPAEFPVRMLRWVQVSPQGNQVAYQALGYIYVRDLPDGTPRRLTQQTDHFEFYPSYSRDGRYLVYTTWHDQRLGSVRVASVAADGEQENWRVTAEPGHYTQPVFSPDGQTIVYTKAAGGYISSPLWSRDTGSVSHCRCAVASRERITQVGIPRPIRRGRTTASSLCDSDSGKEADNLGLFSIDLDGQDERQHFNSKWATDYCISPDGQWIAFIERFHVYVAPFVQTGQTIEIGPNSTALPTAKVSSEAGDWIHFSGDSQQLHWALGPELFTARLDQGLSLLGRDDRRGRKSGRRPNRQPTGQPHRHDWPPTPAPTRPSLWSEAALSRWATAGIIDNGSIVVARQSHRGRRPARRSEDSRRTPR